MEDSRDGCHCKRCRGWSDSGSSQEHSFSKPLMEDLDEQGKAWFNQENLVLERRSMRLERDLEAALNFEHSNGEDRRPKVHPVWIMCILLGCLFRECQALGWEVKMYSRFQ